MRRHQTFETILIGKGVLIREGIARILRAENFPCPGHWYHLLMN